MMTDKAEILRNVPTVRLFAAAVFVERQRAGVSEDAPYTLPPGWSLERFIASLDVRQVKLLREFALSLIDQGEVPVH